MKLTLIDFKNHERTSVDFTGSTQISGRNGSGKTSVLEGILYAYYGRDFYGKMVGEGCVRHGRPGCTVLLEGQDVIKRSWGTEGNVYINGKKMRQLDVAAEFPPMELAYALVNPLYLMYEVTPFGIRKLLMQHMQLPSREDLFLRKYPKELLDKFKVQDFESARREKKSLESSIASLNKEEELANAEIFSARAQREEIKSKRVRMPSGVLLKETARQKQIQEIEEKIKGLDNPRLRKKEVEDWMTVQKNCVEENCKEVGVDTLTELLNYWADAYTELKREYESVSGKLAIQDEVLVKLGRLSDKELCPVCGSSLSNIGGLFEKTAGERDRLKGVLGELTPRLEDAKGRMETFKEIKAELVIRRKDLALYKKRVVRLENLEEKLEKLKELQKGLTEQDFRNAVESEAQKRMLDNIKARIYDYKEKIVRLKESRKQLEAQLKEAKVIEEALSPQGVEAEQAIYMGEELQKELQEFFGKEVKVETVKRNKSNENFREIFNIRIGRTGMVSLSYGERILLMVVLSVILRRHIKDFRFDFMLLDESSVLSEDNMKKVVEYVEGAGLWLIYTRASDSGLTFKKVQHDRD